MKGKREIIAETFEPDEPCDCECQMLETIRMLVHLANVQSDQIKLLNGAIEIQAEAILNLQNRILLLEMAMRGMDYDEEECECGCGG